MNSPGNSEPESGPNLSSDVERIRLTSRPVLQALLLLLIIGVGGVCLVSWAWLTKRSDGAIGVALLWASAVVGLVPSFLLGRLTVRRIRAAPPARRGTPGWAYVALGAAPVIGIVLARSFAPSGDAGNELIIGIGGVLSLWLLCYLVGFGTGASPDID